MNIKQITKENIVNYLLGEPTDDARDKIEDRLFMDADFADVLDETENDLIDDYVRGDLESTQRKSFEQFFLISDRRREKVKLARILNNEVFRTKSVVVTAKPEKISFWESLSAFFRLPILNIALAVLVLAAALIGVFLILQSPKDDIATNINKNITPNPSPIFTPNNSNSENTNSQQNVAVSNSNVNNLNENRPTKTPLKNGNLNVIPTPTPPIKNENKPITAPQPIFAAILLTPMSRSNESPTLKMPNTAKLARLQIVNDEKNVYERLRIDVVNSNGGLVFRQNFDGKRQLKTFVINIPAEKLANEEYEITLSGAHSDKDFKDLNYYRFSVQKK